MLNPIAFIPTQILDAKACGCVLLIGQGYGKCECGILWGGGYPPIF